MSAKPLILCEGFGAWASSTANLMVKIAWRTDQGLLRWNRHFSPVSGLPEGHQLGSIGWAIVLSDDNSL